MNSAQQAFLLFFASMSFFYCVRGLVESQKKKNAFGLTPYLLPLGAFVWADAVIFGLFWTLVSLAALFLQDWYLFLLIVSIFWVVRSLGETIYWFNQQFSTVNRNPIENLLGKHIFHNDSIWFVYQIAWQCVTAISTVSSIYFAWMWIQTLGK